MTGVAAEVVKILEWDLNDLDLYPGDFVSFHVEVDDNDEFSGHKTSRTPTLRLRLPTLGELYAEMQEKDEHRMTDLEEVLEKGRDVWENAANAADGEWTQLHVLVKFDDEVNRRLDHGWARLLRVERLQVAGVLGAIVMIVLGAVYSYLRIDLKTGGAYRGRLRAGALAAIDPVKHAELFGKPNPAQAHGRLDPPVACQVGVQFETVEIGSVSHGVAGRTSNPLVKDLHERIVGRVCIHVIESAGRIRVLVVEPQIAEFEG